MQSKSRETDMLSCGRGAKEKQEAEEGSFGTSALDGDGFQNAEVRQSSRRDLLPAPQDAHLTLSTA